MGSSFVFRQLCHDGDRCKDNPLRNERSWWNVDLVTCADNHDCCRNGLQANFIIKQFVR